MKKPMIKALAAAMAITMAISTPLSAEAAGLADLYKTEAQSEDGGNGQGSHTDTGTGTGTEIIRAEEPASASDIFKVKRLKLDKDAITLAKKGTELLTVTVVAEKSSGSGSDGAVETVVINAANLDAYDEATFVVNGKSTGAKELLDSVGWDVDNSEIATIRPTKNKGVVEVTGIASGKTKVNAYMELDLLGLGDDYLNFGFQVSADVTVTSHAEKLYWKDLPSEFYLNHKDYNLKDYLYFDDGEDKGISSWSLTEEISWELKASSKKATTYVSVDANGNLKIKKLTLTNQTIQVRAVSEEGIYTDWSDPFKVTRGNPAKSVTIEGKSDHELGQNTSNDKNFRHSNENYEHNILTYTASITPEKEGTTTDKITWTVSGCGLKYTITTDADKNNKATLEVNLDDVKKAGKLTVTAKAMSGKKGTKKTTVTAKVLNHFWVSGTKYTAKEDPVSLYVGQSLKAETCPYAFSSKFKYEFIDAEVKKVLKINSSKGTITLKKGKEWQTGLVQVKISIPKARVETTAEVMVYSNDVKSVKIANKEDLEKSTRALYVGGAYVAKAALVGADGNVLSLNSFDVGSLVSWKCDKPKIAQIIPLQPTGDLMIIPVKSGTANITLSAVKTDGRMAKQTMKIQVKTAATKINLNKSKVYLNPGKKDTTVKLTASFPKGSDKEDVTWSITDSKYIKIKSSNKLKASIAVNKEAVVGEKATATVAAANGAVATAAIEIVPKMKEVKIATAETGEDGIKVERKKNVLRIKFGESFDLNDVVTFIADDAGETEYKTTNYEPLYKITGNKGYVTFKNGVLYGIKESGKKSVKIEIKDPAGKKKAIVTVYVTPESED